MKRAGLMVGRVAPGSIAAEVGVDPGDTVLAVNGRELSDILDYHFHTGEDLVRLDLARRNGEVWDLEIEKDPGQDLGLEFTSTGLERITRCANKCIFCFVDQMPGGMRKTLYVKDDDYRLSFLQGSFITLTNMREKDFRRVAELRLSPLYVSVHTTNPDLRRKMLGNPGAGDVLAQLERLAREGIEIHTQAVICPGVNDDRELERTVADLAGIWPGVRSLALVPVGLTGAREGLSPLGQFTPAGAAAVVNRVRGWQNGCLKTLGYPFVFAGDEFYLRAGKEFPSRQRYADFPQTENGVGLARLFLDGWAGVKRRIPAEIKSPLSLSIITGVLAGPILDRVARDLNRVENLDVRVVAVENRFFGPTVTVSGLLTGSDLIGRRDQIKQSGLALLPASMFRRDQPLTLDDKSPEDLEKALGVPLRVAQGPGEILEIIKSFAGD